MEYKIHMKNNMSDLYENMHKKYDISRTLRFELKPIGKTKENIEKNGILTKDEYRAKIYKKVKNYCDEYHKFFIDNCLKDFKLDEKLLEEYYILYNNLSKTEEEKNRFILIQTNLREAISNKFQKDKKYKYLFEKKLIEEYLLEFFKDDLDKTKEISEFKRFTTYFNNYNLNRKNMYVSDEKSTAIAYRIINENLPTFINNLKIFNKAKENLQDEIASINKELYGYMQVENIEKIFSLTYFNEILTQEGIDKYNLIISGKSEENNNKIKGLNEYINLYNQKPENKNSKEPRLSELRKQILSNKMDISFAFDVIHSDIELVQSIKYYYIDFQKNLNKEKNLIENIDNYDSNKIFINNDSSLNKISNEIFENWSQINSLIDEDYDKNYNGKKKIGALNYEEERKKVIKNRKNYSLNYLEKLINENFPEKSIINYFKNYIEKNNIIKNIEKYYSQCDEFINFEYEENSKTLIKNEKAIEKIKALLDEIKKLQNFIKLLIPKDKTLSKDDRFYNNLEETYIQLIGIIPLYNKTRNYLTQKPYSKGKIKLNFETPVLLDGWDLNKERDNLGVLFKKKNNYYLGIINPYNRKIFVGTECNNDETDYYQKMEYKLLPGPNKMLPKVFFSKSRIQEFNPNDELVFKYEKGYHKKGKNFDITFCHELIDFYKASINKHEDWNKFNFKFKDTNEYNDIGEFYKDVEKQGYKISFKNYSSEYINSLVEIGDLYLFQIYNKDFSTYSKGKPNLHTMYWKALFDENNLKDIVFKLNGKSEIFYRKASLKLEDTAIHKRGEKINHKTNPEKTSKFEYDLIKDKRYTENKFQLHVPITINFVNDGIEYLNEEVNKYLKYNDVNVIGIDRGERNLLYITVVDPKGNILKQISLNEINNEKHTIDYHDLLNKKELEREKARESWETIENIKELKEGYLSQVVHEIGCLMEKYKAIIVIEDLNNGFKNSRIKVEKQVYQKFEKKLIEKLNYLVFKDKDFNEEGGLLNGYQLTNKFNGFNKIGRQTGILFYIPAWCTSKIDPTTGFVNFLNFKYENIEKSKNFISKFDNIIFNEKEDYFEFKIDYSKFTNKSYGTRKNWAICTYGNRIETFRNSEKNQSWDTKEINLTDEFKKLFKDYGIDLFDIKNQCLKQENREFWRGFLKLLKLTVQMRNSIPNTSVDYLISPIKNNKGYFYNSNNADLQLPLDADANGAYNIARKGLLMIEQIRKTDDIQLRKIKFKISNQDWLEYVQKKDK